MAHKHHSFSLSRHTTAQQSALNKAKQSLIFKRLIRNMYYIIKKPKEAQNLKPHEPNQAIYAFNCF